MRAARFPCGTATSGAAGPGVAESAISRRKLASPAESAEPTSGAAMASVRAGFLWAVGADIGCTGIFGCGLTLGAAAMLKGPGVFSTFATSGTVTSGTVRRSMRGAAEVEEI